MTDFRKEVVEGNEEVLSNLSKESNLLKLETSICARNGDHERLSEETAKDSETILKFASSSII